MEATKQLERAPSAALTPASIASNPTPPKGTSRKLADGRGLHLLLKDNGSRLWRLKFYLRSGLDADGKLAERKELTYSIGPYPAVSINAAREAAAEARKLIKQGINPIDRQREQRTKAYVASVTTFGSVSERYLAIQLEGKSEATQDKLKWQRRKLESLFDLAIADIKASRVIGVLREIEALGFRESAHRVGQFASRVFRFAVQEDLCSVNPVADLRGALKPKAAKSHAGITEPTAFGALMRFIDAEGGAIPVVKAGLRLLARTFVRPGELRQALWTEFDLVKAEWRIPAERMKMRRPHLVPLSTQVVTLLKAHRAVTGQSPLVFPNLLGTPMSENAMGDWLKAHFYDKAEHVPHGFRVSASTLLHEAGIDPALIELQLSHAKADKIAGIYDRSQRVPERRELMQRWADMIDAFKALT